MKECRICLELVTVEEQCEVCQWKSCDACRAEWAKYNNTCPGCRTELFPREDLPPPPVDTRVSVLVVCRILFITIDVVLFFVLFGLFTILLVEDSNCNSGEYACEGFDFMVMFVIVCALFSFRTVLHKWIMNCCVVNMDNAAVGFVELEDNSSEEETEV